MNDHVWKEALEYARWAPSPHNTQLWKVKIISPSVLEVYYEEDRLLPVENASNSFMICGMGAFIEALSIALAPKGFAVAISFAAVVPSSEKGLVYFCTATLADRAAPETLDRELLLTRRTSRLPYKPEVVSTEIRVKLAEEAKRFGHLFSFSTDSVLIEKMLIINKDTLFYDMEDAATRTEVDGWVRYSKSHAQNSKDGLWTYCLQIPAFFAYLFFRVRFIFNIGLVRGLVGAFYLKTMAGTKNVGWISGPMQDRDEWLASGRMLMRLWLIMARENIYLHPFGSVVTNPKSHREALSLLSKKDTPEDTLWLIMRFGYSEVPPRSFRLPVESLILT